MYLLEIEVPADTQGREAIKDNTVSSDRKYLSYLLRLWKVEENGESVWRASLEETHSGKKYGFANPESLFMFLSEQTRSYCTSNTAQQGSTKE
jgi:hypothetical protein